MWTSIVNSAEENRANFRKAVDVKLLSSCSLRHEHGKPNELKAVLKASAEAE